MPTRSPRRVRQPLLDFIDSAVPARTASTSPPAGATARAPPNAARALPSPGPAYDAITDVPGIRVGHWTNRRAATGCTVVIFDAGAVGGVDVRGAAPGHARDRPAPPREHRRGGARGGARRRLRLRPRCRDRRDALPRGARHRPRVRRQPHPDRARGRALRPRHRQSRPTAARRRRRLPRCRARPRRRGAEGSVGAGTGATVAKQAGRDRRLKGGLGTASEVLATGVIVGALAAVNAVGNIVDPATAGSWRAPRGDRRGASSMSTRSCAPARPGATSTPWSPARALDPRDGRCGRRRRAGAGPEHDARRRRDERGAHEGAGESPRHGVPGRLRAHDPARPHASRWRHDLHARHGRGGGGRRRLQRARGVATRAVERAVLQGRPPRRGLAGSLGRRMARPQTHGALMRPRRLHSGLTL